MLLKKFKMSPNDDNRWLFKIYSTVTSPCKWIISASQGTYSIRNCHMSNLHATDICQTGSFCTQVQSWRRDWLRGWSDLRGSGQTIPAPDSCLNKCIFYQINLVAKPYQPRHVPEQVHLHQSTIAASGISQLPTFVRHTQHKPFQFEYTPLLWAVLRSSLLFDTDLSPKSINQCIFIWVHIYIIVTAFSHPSHSHTYLRSNTACDGSIVQRKS